MDHRFEAWRNFMLILAGVLVGNMLNYYMDIRAATVFLMEYDRPLASALFRFLVPELVAILICLYFFKSVHGVLVTIFDEEYRASLVGSDVRAMISCGLMTAVVFSLGFVGLLSNNVFEQRTAVHAAMAFVLMASPPIIVFLLFDLFHHVLRRGAIPKIPWRRLFASKKTKEEVCGTWLFEDYASAVPLLLLLVFLSFPGLRSAEVIVATIAAVVVAAAMNSFFDYVANRAYFFSFIPALTGEPEHRAPERTDVDGPPEAPREAVAPFAAAAVNTPAPLTPVPTPTPAPAPVPAPVIPKPDE